MRFPGRILPPNFTETDIVPGLLESLQIAFLSSLIGTCAIPIVVLAARNLMPAGVSWVARLVIIFAVPFIR